MAGQSLIIATGAIEYPAEYQAMAPEALSQLGIRKQSPSAAPTIIASFRVRSPAPFWRGFTIDSGRAQFYDDIFADLGIAHVPFRWNTDRNPRSSRRHQTQEQTIRQAGVMELINAYRVRGHLIADIDPLHAMPVLYHPELDIETYGLTIWDLDREFITGGLAGTESATCANSGHPATRLLRQSRH